MTTASTHTTRRFLFPLVVALAALALTAVACDDDGTPGDPDTGTLDTSGDTGSDADTAADVPDDTDTDEPDTDTDTDTGGDDTDTGGDTDDVADTDGVDMVDTTDMGGCPDGCGTNQVCNEAAGMCECGVSFADCDDDIETNGCETNISVPEQCGGCGDMADPVCQRFGIEPSCMLVTDQYRCGSDCQDGYLDLDGDAGTENASNGCETGLVAGTAQDLSAALGNTGDIVALEHDGTTLFALTDDGTEYTLHALTVAGDGSVTVVASQPVGASNGSDDIAVTIDGFIAISVTTQNVFYQFDGTSFVALDSDVKTNAAAVAALSAPLVANSQAEFVAAVGGGIVWYGVFAQASDAPDSGACETNGRVCTIDTSPQPTNAVGILVADLGGTPWSITLGDSTFEHGFDAVAPNLDQAAAGGATIPTTSADLQPLEGDRVAAVHDDGTVHVYQYALSAGEPDTRTDARTITPDTGSATELEVLDADRWLIGTDMGLTVALIEESSVSQAAVDQPLTSVDALVVHDGRAYVAAGQQMVVIDLDLGTLDTAAP